MQHGRALRVAAAALTPSDAEGTRGAAVRARTSDGASAPPRARSAAFARARALRGILKRRPSMAHVRADGRLAADFEKLVSLLTSSKRLKEATAEHVAQDRSQERPLREDQHRTAQSLLSTRLQQINEVATTSTRSAPIGTAGRPAVLGGSFRRQRRGWTALPKSRAGGVIASQFTPSRGCSSGGSDPGPHRRARVAAPARDSGSLVPLRRSRWPRGARGPGRRDAKRESSLSDPALTVFHREIHSLAR